MLGAELLPQASAEALTRLAGSIPIPVGARGVPALAYVASERDGPDHELNRPCGHRYQWRVYWALEGGRRREPFGPRFERSYEALRLAELLNGGSSEHDHADATEPVRPRLCIACQGPLPAGSRPHRRTCSATCRQHVARRARAPEQGSRESKARDARGEREGFATGAEAQAPAAAS